MTKQKKISLILIYVSIVISIFLFGIFYAVKKPVQAVEQNNSQDLSQRVKEYLKNDDLYYAYVKGEVKETQLIAFHEVGFNKADHKILKYHFYLYVPKKHKLQDVQKDLEMRYFNNRVITLSGQIVEKNDSDRFYLIEMTCRHDFDGQHIIEKGVEKGYREYVLGYIPWRYDGVDYQPENVDRKYIYKGYEKGLDESTKEKSTLTASYESTKYLDLNVKGVCYSGGLVNYNSRYQLYSVYFGISRNITDKYGYLKKIKAAYYETQLAPILVTKDELAYFEIKAMQDRKYTSRDDDLDGSEAYVADGYRYILDLNKKVADYLKNNKSEKNVGNYLNQFSLIYQRESSREYKIYSDKIKGDFPLNPKDMPQEKETMPDENGNTKSVGHIVKEFDNEQSIKTEDHLDKKTSAFQRFFHYGLKSPDGSTKVDFENAIEKVTGDIVFGNKEDLSKKYKVDEYYLNDLKQAYLNNNLEGKDTYLLRYAVRKTTWESNVKFLRVNLYEHKVFGKIKVDLVKADDPNFTIAPYMDIVRVPMFLDFNIISLTLKNKTGETEIYTKSSPINHIPDLIVPADTSLRGKLQSFWGELEKILKILGIVLGVLMAVTVIGLITKLVPKGNTKVKIDPGMDLSKNRNKIKQRRRK